MIEYIRNKFRKRKILQAFCRADLDGIISIGGYHHEYDDLAEEVFYRIQQHQKNNDIFIPWIEQEIRIVYYVLYYTDFSFIKGEEDVVIELCPYDKLFECESLQLKIKKLSEEIYRIVS